jgi:hypothetical protein
MAAAVIARDKRSAVKLMKSHLDKTAMMLESVEELWAADEVSIKCRNSK